MELQSNGPWSSIFGYLEAHWRFRMPADERIASLRTKHAAIENAIDAEEHRPHPDDLRIVELKREKLRIKDEIAGHMDS